MKDEEYFKLKDVFKRGKLLEIRKIKKETLLEFIQKTAQKISEKEEKLGEKLDSSSLLDENYKKCTETLKECENHVKDLTERLIKKGEECLNAELEILSLKEKYNSFKIKSFISILILTISLIISIIL